MQGSTFIALQLEEKGHSQKVHILCMEFMTANRIDYNTTGKPLYLM